MKLCLIPLILAAHTSDAFVPTPTRTSSQKQQHASSNRYCRSTIVAKAHRNFEMPDLFEDDEDMIPVAEAYIHAKYKQIASSHGHTVATKDDVREILHSILPPVTQEELQKEEELILKDLLSHKQNSPDSIDEDDFVKSIFNNSYWREAGDIVVKELMYFDSLHCYYKTGKPLLNNVNYDELHENLTWEGSTVATMNAKEAEFVSAIAASKRGEPFMEDEEYKALKTELKGEGSWVVNRKEDQLEKLGLNTFIGYLHRAMP